MPVIPSIRDRKIAVSLKPARSTWVTEGVLSSSKKKGKNEKRGKRTQKLYQIALKKRNKRKRLPVGKIGSFHIVIAVLFSDKIAKYNHLEEGNFQTRFEINKI